MKTTRLVLVAGVALLLSLAAIRAYHARVIAASTSRAPRGKAVQLVTSLPMRELPRPIAIDPVGRLRLEGQVIDEHELPVADAEIVVDANPPRVLRSGPDGVFELDGLIARDYRLEARTADAHAGPAEVHLGPASEPVILRLFRAGSLDVEVRAAPSGTPVASAAIELRSGLVWKARSDEHGRAHLAGVGAGWPTLHVSADGYASAALLLHTSGDPRQPQRQIVTLARGAAVEGRVLDEDGRPVAAARVVALATAEPFPVLDDARDGVVSAQDGRWRIDALAAGSYRFVASPAEMAPGSTPPIALDGEHARGDVEIRVGRGATLRGRVVTESGQPVAAALVRVEGTGSVSWRMSREAYSDGEGRFLFRGLPARAVEIAASSEDGASELARLDLRGDGERELDLTISIRGSIAGVVVSADGRELPEARVLAEPVESGALGERESWWDVRALSSTVADGGGRFRYTGLPPGTYRVRAARPGASDDALWMAKGVDAAVGTRALRVIARADGRVRGRVRYKDGTRPEIFSVEIGAAHPEPFSPTDGAFELDAPGGTQDVVLTGPTFQRTTVAGVKITEGATVELGEVTVEKGRSVSGRVLDQSGRPVADALVAGGLLLTGNGSQLDIPSEGFRVQETQSDASGRYLLRGFGEHPIVVVAQRDGVGRSASVRIPRGPSSVEVDLALQPTTSLAGKITRDDAPLPDTVVIANPRGAMSSNFFVTTGADGGYVFDTLAAGDYVVAPMMGGGSMNPKDMLYSAVSLVAGQPGHADFDARTGPASLDVKLLDAAGAVVPVAELLVVGGTTSAPNAESLLDGAWLPTGAALVPMYFRMSIGAVPARIAGMQAGAYSACAVPIAVDPNDRVAMRAIRDTVNSLPMHCSSVSIHDGAQTVELRVAK